MTAGFPGNLYSTQEAAIDGDMTKLVDGPMYEMDVSINTSGREGWETANVGAAGHSGGGVWIDYTDPDGNATQKIIGDYTFANASGLNGANRNSQTYRGVGGNLLTNFDKENIDAYLKSQGYKAGQLPTDVIHGSDGNDRFALDSTDFNAPAALSGSFKNEIIYGNGGDDIIYTGARPSDVDGETPSGDTISGGAGADTLVFGPGTHEVLDESRADRAGDRIAVLLESTTSGATSEGATPDAAEQRLVRASRCRRNRGSGILTTLDLFSTASNISKLKARSRRLTLWRMLLRSGDRSNVRSISMVVMSASFAHDNQVDVVYWRPSYLRFEDMMIYRVRSVLAGLLASFAPLFAVPALADSEEPARPADGSGPPITIMPLREVEPRRNLPAVQWKSPYCAEWDDGCTRCTRKAVGDKPMCEPMDDYIGGGTCRPRGIVCAGPIRHQYYSEIDRMCAEWGWASIVRTGLVQRSGVALFLATFEYDKKAGAWKGDAEAEGPLDAPKNEQFARRIFATIGRSAQDEFASSNKDFVQTLFCLESRAKDDRSNRSLEDWFQTMGEMKR